MHREPAVRCSGEWGAFKSVRGRSFGRVYIGAMGSFRGVPGLCRCPSARRVRSRPSINIGVLARARGGACGVLSNLWRLLTGVRREDKVKERRATYSGRI